MHMGWHMYGTQLEGVLVLPIRSRKQSGMAVHMTAVLEMPHLVLKLLHAHACSEAMVDYQDYQWYLGILSINRHLPRTCSGVPWPISSCAAALQMDSLPGKVSSSTAYNVRATCVYVHRRSKGAEVKPTIVIKPLGMDVFCRGRSLAAPRTACAKSACFHRFSNIKY